MANGVRLHAASKLPPASATKLVISPPLPTLAFVGDASSKLPKRSSPVKSLFLPKPRNLTTSTPPKSRIPSSSRPVSKSTISNPIPIAVSLPGFAAGYGATKLDSRRAASTPSANSISCISMNYVPAEGAHRRNDESSVATLTPSPLSQPLSETHLVPKNTIPNDRECKSLSSLPRANGNTINLSSLRGRSLAVPNTAAEPPRIPRPTLLPSPTLHGPSSTAAARRLKPARRVPQLNMGIMLPTGTTGWKGNTISSSTYVNRLSARATSISDRTSSPLGARDSTESAHDAAAPEQMEEHNEYSWRLNAHAMSRLADESPLLGSSPELGLVDLNDCEALMGVELPYQLTTSTPPFTPLISPHSPVPTSTLDIGIFHRETPNVGSTPPSPSSTCGGVTQAFEDTSTVVWSFTELAEEKKPVLSLDIVTATSLRDEVTRGLVSAVDHMLDDTQLLFPESAIDDTPVREFNWDRLPTVQHLRFSHVDAVVQPRAVGRYAVRDVSLHMPVVHKDVWAAYWALHRMRDTVDDLDIDTYFSPIVSPV